MADSVRSRREARHRDARRWWRWGATDEEEEEEGGEEEEKKGVDSEKRLGDEGLKVELLSQEGVETVSGVCWSFKF